MKTLMDIFFIIFGLYAIIFHNFATGLIIKWNEEFLGWYKYSNGEVRILKVGIIVVGIVFFALGILSLLGYIKWK